MKYERMTPEIENLKNKHNELYKVRSTVRQYGNDIQLYNKKMEEIDLKITELLGSKKVYAEKISQIKEKLCEFTGSIKTPDVQCDEINKQIDELNRKLKKYIQTEYKDSMLKISSENCMTVTLRRQTKTTQIIDEFYHSDKDFLRLMTWWQCNQVDMINLIVTRGYDNIEYNHVSAPTITELKQHSSGYMYEESFPESMKPLIAEIRKICTNNTLKLNDIVLFDKPFPLRAQIYANQSGFGWEWEWGNLVSEGTLYGETTLFYVGGFQVIKF